MMPITVLASGGGDDNGDWSVGNWGFGGAWMSGYSGDNVTSGTTADDNVAVSFDAHNNGVAGTADGSLSISGSSGLTVTESTPGTFNVNHQGTQTFSFTVNVPNATTQQGTINTHVTGTINTTNPEMEGHPHRHINPNNDTTSDREDAEFHVDSGVPTATVNISADGSKATISASDPVSGLGSVTYSLNGSAYAPYTGAISLPYGVSNLSVKAFDIAGNWIIASSKSNRIAPTGVGQLVPQCPLCKQILNYTENIRAYEWTSPQGGKQVKQFYLCPKCGFNNAINAQGDVVLDLNKYQGILMNYKKSNGTTIVPDYDLFRYDMPKQSYPVSLPYMK
jgi:hypothetical protein